MDWEVERKKGGESLGLYTLSFNTHFEIESESARPRISLVNRILVHDTGYEGGIDVW
jgi:hypothetical protein